MTSISQTAAAVALILLFTAGIAHTDGAGDPKAVSSREGEYLDKGGNPTFKIDSDGTVDWYTYVGYLRYGANCLQCHGPDGLGSSYAPSLVDSLKSLSYGDFVSTVASGKKEVNTAQTQVMPSFGTNKNVMCYIDAIYVYLRARSDEALSRQRPGKHEPETDAYAKAEDSCMS
jgi:methanol metabolism-related c-type cytochrome